MMKKKLISVLVIMLFIICIPNQSLAADFDLDVKFDGKSNITMESKTPEMSWDLNCLLPGQKDTSSLNITNTGKAPVTLKMTISIEEDSGLLEMVNVSVKNKSGTELYNGKYTQMGDVTTSITPGNTESYTIDIAMDVNAGNEYQNKQYKLKFNFVASGNINIDVPNSVSTNVVTKPKTGDNIIKYVVIGVSVLALLIIIVIIKKKNNKEG